MREYRAERFSSECDIGFGARGYVRADNPMEAVASAFGVRQCRLEMRKGIVQCAEWVVFPVDSNRKVEGPAFSVRERWS